MEGNKKRYNKKVMAFLWIAFVIYSIITTLLRVDGLLIKNYSEISQYVSLDDDWDIEVNNSLYQDVSLTDFKCTSIGKGDRVVMQRVLPKKWNVTEGTLRIRIKQSAIKMYVDNQLIYEYGYDRVSKNKTVGSGYQFVDFPEQYKGKKLKIELYVAEDNAFGRFDSVRLYEWKNAYKALITDNRLPMFLGSFLTIFGLVLLIITLFAVVLSPKYIRVFCIAIFSICVGLWTLCYYKVISVYAIPAYSVSLLEHMTLYLSPLPIIIYMLENVNNLKKVSLTVIYWVLFALQILFDVVAVVLHAKDIVHFAVVLKYWQILVVVELIYFTLVLVMNLKFSKKIGRFYLFGMLSIFACIGYDLAGYYCNHYIGYQLSEIKGLTSIGVTIFIFVMIFTFYINLTEKMMQEKERDFLIKSAYTDDLTQLSNRRYCSEYMRKINDEEIQDYTLFCFDLNNLKVTNDTYGHAKGDIIIKSAAEVISETFSAYGVVGRMGGDEFIAILKISRKEDIEELIKEFLANIAKKNKEELDVELSISYGYVMGHEVEEKNIEKIYQIADNRMYENKKAYKMKKNCSY